jgi:enterochelin esterase family protein
VSGRFAPFINDDVFTAVLNTKEIKEAYPKLALTDDPWGRGAVACSSGGAAAITMGWFRPDLSAGLISAPAFFVGYLLFAMGVLATHHP